MKDTILGIAITPQQRRQVLSTIESCLTSRKFTQIISLNPEIVIESLHNQEYQAILQGADIKLIDGAGMIVAGNILGVDVGERYPGVDLMKDLLKMADKKKLKVLVMGGRNNVIEKFVKKMSEEYPHCTFKGSEGFLNINRPTEDEEKEVLSMLGSFNPQIVFTAFGAPFQDVWISVHKKQLGGIVCMGVGGGVDFLAGVVPRAPMFMRSLGFEWLFRLIVQPWRWRRQLRLVEFVYRVIKQRLF